MTETLRVQRLTHPAALANLDALRILLDGTGHEPTAAIVGVADRFRTARFEASFLAVTAEADPAGAYPPGTIVAVLLGSADRHGRDHRIDATAGDPAAVERLKGAWRVTVDVADARTTT